MDTPGATGQSVRPMHAHLWLIYLAAGGVAMIAYAFVPVGLPTAIIYELVGLSSVGAVLLGIHLHQPERRLPWQLMAAGLALWTVADGVGNWLSNVLGIDAFPTVADPIYLLGYAVVAAGIVVLIGRHHGRDTAGTLDSLILTTSLAVLSWVLLARPTIATYQDSPVAAAVAVSYPIADIVLAGLLIRLVTTAGGRTRSYRLLVLALVLLIAADTASSALQLLTFADSQPLDYLWMASYLVWGAAALDRSMVSLSAPRGAHEHPLLPRAARRFDDRGADRSGHVGGRDSSRCEPDGLGRRHLLRHRVPARPGQDEPVDRADPGRQRRAHRGPGRADPPGGP